MNADKRKDLILFDSPLLSDWYKRLLRAVYADVPGSMFKSIFKIVVDFKNANSPLPEIGKDFRTFRRRLVGFPQQADRIGRIGGRRNSIIRSPPTENPPPPPPPFFRWQYKSVSIDPSVLNMNQKSPGERGRPTYV